MRKIQLIDPNLDFEIKVTHNPKAWAPKGERINSIIVSVHAELIKNYNYKDVSKLEIKGFEKSKKKDFGYSQYGYEYFFNHPKYGEIKIAYGFQGYNCWVDVVNDFRVFGLSSEKKFDIDSYQNEAELEVDVEQYARYLKEQVLLFIENFNKENDPNYGRIQLDANRVISRINLNLKKN